MPIVSTRASNSKFENNHNGKQMHSQNQRQSGSWLRYLSENENFNFDIDYIYDGFTDLLTLLETGRPPSYGQSRLARHNLRKPTNDNHAKYHQEIPEQYSKFYVTSGTPINGSSGSKDRRVIDSEIANRKHRANTNFQFELDKRTILDQESYASMILNEDDEDKLPMDDLSVYQREVQAERLKLKNTKGAMRNKDLDFTTIEPHNHIDDKLMNYIEVLPKELLDFKVKQLEEPYPSQLQELQDQKEYNGDQSNSLTNLMCQNGGKAYAQTQMIFSCQSPFYNQNKSFRVTKDQFSYLSKLNLKDTLTTKVFSCVQQAQTQNVCVCPAQYTGGLCSQKHIRKCQVQITDPNLMQGCTDRPDSEYYTFSQGGFAPCWPFDFGQKKTIEYYLKCYNYYDGDDDDEVNLKAKPTDSFSQPRVQVGYKYRDVIKPAQFDPSDVFFTQTNLNDDVTAKNATLTVKLKLRDMKYLSNYYRVDSVISKSDSYEYEQGLQPGYFTDVDFPLIEANDTAKNSYYVVGGRVYFTAELSSSDKSVDTFVTHGFFDKQGYVEPTSKYEEERKLILLSVCVGVLLILVGLVCYCCCCKKKSKLDKQIKKRLRE